MPQRIEPMNTEDPLVPQVITLPTHLKVEDTLFRFGQVKVTARQFVLLLAGGSLIYTLWMRTAWLAASLAIVGTGMHWSLLVVSCAVLLALTFGNIAGRTLDSWLLLLFVYRLRPRIYVWSNVRREPASAIEEAESVEREDERSGNGGNDGSRPDRRKRPEGQE